MIKQKTVIYSINDIGCNEASTGRWTDLWNAIPTSERNTSRFLPLKFCLAESRTFSSVSQQASHGSVFTLANERSSLRGLKSLRFCFDSCVDNHETIAGSTGEWDALKKVNEHLQSVIRCKRLFAPPSIRLTVWLLNMTISRRIVTEELAKGSNAVLMYCCQRCEIRSANRNTVRSCRFGSDLASAASRRAWALCAWCQEGRIIGGELGNRKYLTSRWPPRRMRYRRLQQELEVERRCFWR